LIFTDVLKSIKLGRMNEQEVISMAGIKTCTNFWSEYPKGEIFGVLIRSQKILLKWILLICEERGLYLTGS